MSITNETITVDVSGAVATITLQRPEVLNALSVTMAAELGLALSHLDADPSVRAIVLTGAGRGFTSGADLNPGPEDVGPPDVLGHLRATYNPLILTLRGIATPVIAAVNGGAVGIGVSLICACDLVVAAESAYFLLAFAKIGLTIDGGISASLAARIGFARAAELALLAERLPAAQAMEWGLVNRVVPDAQLAATAGELAARIAAGPPGSNRATKALLNRACFPDIAEQLDREAVLQGRQAESAEFAEGVRAFFEKRPPDFPDAAA